jgi:SAM-dependent methyltransferase
VDEESLPLNDASIDRVLLVHCLETAHEERNQLREVWRVLAPGGRLLLVVPNRQGIWARTETTPFGTGRPFGRTQLTQLLRDANFSPLGWSEALYVPPFRRRSWVRTGATWERIGRWLWPAFAGVIIVEATKQLYQGLPARERARLKPAFTPALIPPGA